MVRTNTKKDVYKAPSNLERYLNEFVSLQAKKNPSPNKPTKGISGALNRPVKPTTQSAPLLPMQPPGYESPLMKGIIDDVMSGKSTEVPDRQFMTDKEPYVSPLMKGILDDTMNQITTGQTQEIPYRKYMRDVEPTQATPPIMPKVSSKSKKKVFSQFPPTQKLQAPTGFDTPAQAPQEDSLMAQLERAIRAKEDAIGQNMDQYRALASKAADYTPTSSFGGLTDYANFVSGRNMQPAQDTSYDERSALMNRLQQQLAQSNEAATAPGIDLAEAKIKMDQYNQEMALKKEQLAQSAKEKEADRQFKMGLLREQIAGRLQAAALAKGTKMNEGMKKFSRDTATQLTDFTSGGKETLEGTLEKLKGAVLTMKRDPKITGTTVASLTSALPATGLTNSKLKALIDDVVEPVFQTMRSKIGAQFTAQESKQLQQLAINPNLPTSANIKKVEAAIAIIEGKYNQMQDKLNYFQENNGDMSGYMTDLAGKKTSEPKDINSLSDEALMKLHAEKVGK